MSPDGGTVAIGWTASVDNQSTDMPLTIDIYRVNDGVHLGTTTVPSIYGKLILGPNGTLAFITKSGRVGVTWLPGRG